MKRVYFANLDGLRFFSFLSVFLYHSFYTENSEILNSDVYKFVAGRLFDNGNLGVNFFFVLSGFLITTLLLIEKNEFGQIHIGHFYLRRILRIWPMYFFCVFFGFVIFPQIKALFGQVSNETADPKYYLAFISNFDLIKKGLPDSSVLSVLWSIAVEEQFYLFWPLIIAIFPFKKVWIPFLLLWIISIVFRATHDTYINHEVHTLSCISDMVIGAFGAWFTQGDTGCKRWFQQLDKSKTLLLYLLVAVVFFFRQDLFSHNYYLRVIERSVVGVLFISVILEQCFSNRSFFKMSNFKRISKLGEVTYGLYCLQFIGILITLKLVRFVPVNLGVFQVLVIDTLIALSITIGMALFSYRFFEGPILKLKEKFAFIKK